MNPGIKGNFKKKKSKVCHNALYLLFFLLLMLFRSSRKVLKLQDILFVSGYFDP